MEVPVRAHALLLALHVTEEGAKPVAMHADAPELPPHPLSFAMEALIVVVSLHQVPVLADDHPFAASPAFENAQAVQVTSNLAVATPEPLVGSIVVVPLPEVPVGANVLSAVVPEASQKRLR